MSTQRIRDVWTRSPRVILTVTSGDQHPLHTLVRDRTYLDGHSLMIMLIMVE